VLNLRYAGQYFDAETGTNYNLNRTYEAATGRYLQSDPTGLSGGISTYAYVKNSPLMYSDPLGLATAVLLRGPEPGNPFGHVALAFTDQGVYSYQTHTAFGSSTTDYLSGQGADADQTVYILNTSPEQEQAMMDYIKKNYSNPGNYSKWNHDCATAANGALRQGNIDVPLINAYTDNGGILPNNLPSTTAAAAQDFPGVQTIDIPQGAPIPGSLKAFNPGGQ